VLNIADTTAAPAMLTVGRLWRRRDLLVCPLTLRDLGWYERMGGHAHTVGRMDTLLLIWLGLRKYQPQLTWRHCRQMFRRRRVREKAFHIIDEINPGVFKDIDPDAEKSSAGGTSGHVSVMRCLAAAFKWGPDISFELTPNQAHLYMMGDMSKSIDSLHFDTAEEARAYRDERKAEKAARGES